MKDFTTIIFAKNPIILLWAIGGATLRFIGDGGFSRFNKTGAILQDYVKHGIYGIIGGIVGAMAIHIGDQLHDGISLDGWFYGAWIFLCGYFGLVIKTSCDKIIQDLPDIIKNRLQK